MTGTPFDAQRAAITRLRLTQFRNHPALDLHCDGQAVALVGPNGAGKTNVLEAISMLAPGRGLRRAAHGELAHVPGDGSWAVAARVRGALGEADLGTGTEPGDADTGGRRCRVEGTGVSGPGVFSEHLRIVWLTPAMDGLFTASAGERRRFLDRLVLAIDPRHGTRVAAFERALRSRNRLLEENADPRWLDALEREAAELAVALAAARRETVDRLASLIAEGRGDAESVFPFAEIALQGWVEAGIVDQSAASVEDEYRRRLKEMRARDRAAGRATEGPHTSDLVVVHGPKGVAASRCSTGEQKALLIGLVLAHARLVTRLEAVTPVVLLDEVAAHLDPNRRAALYQALDSLGVQCWMTGADDAMFADLGEGAAVFRIAPGRAERAA